MSSDDIESLCALCPQGSLCCLDSGDFLWSLNLDRSVRRAEMGRDVLKSYIKQWLLSLLAKVKCKLYVKCVSWGLGIILLLFPMAL